MGADDHRRIVETARLLNWHFQHRQYRPGDQAPRGPVRARPERRVQTMLTVLTQNRPFR